MRREEPRGDDIMKKLLTAAAVLALAISTVPSVIGQAEAAPAKSPYCALAKAQKNPVAWNAFYHCLGTPSRPTHVLLRGRALPAKSPFCAMAKAQKNPVAWNAYYHCLSI
jgi:hypothetical protein